MKKMILAILLLTTTTFFLQAQEGSKNFLDIPYLTITGHAEMEVVPDQIYMHIVINEKDNKGKIILAQAEKDMMTTLTGLSIDTKKDLSVVDMSSNFKNYWIKSSDVMTSKEYQLLVRDAQTAGKVMKGLEKCGISNVSIEKVSHSKLEQFKTEIKLKAIKNAKEMASQLAQALGQTIGKALYVEDYQNNAENFLQGRLAGIKIKRQMIADEAMGEPDVEFQKIKLEGSVLCRFELK